MRALAILGPQASARDLRRFSFAGVEIKPVERLDNHASADAVLIFGGDGTVHRYLPALAALQLPLLIVPMGSGNDFAMALSIRSYSDALTAWNEFYMGRGNVWQVDLGIIAHSEGLRTPFCCVAGAGLDAEANRRANAMPRWLRAHGGYAFAVIGAMAGFRPPRMQVNFEVDGAARLLDAPATMVAVANAPSYGRGMRIGPRAQLDDGLLDLCFVRRVAPLRLLRFFPRVYSGAHLDLAEVEYAQTPRLRIEANRPLHVYADGEYVCRTPVELTLQPRALKVIFDPVHHDQKWPVLSGQGSARADSSPAPEPGTVSE